MRKLVIFIGIAISVCISSCSRPDKKEQSKSAIVLLFDSIKPNYDTLKFSNGMEAENTKPILTMRSSVNQTKVLSLADTIRIDSVQNYVILCHKYQPFSSIDFILYPGDTAHISYVNEVPYIQIVNHRSNTLGTNYDYYKQQRYSAVREMKLLDIVQNPNIIVAYALIEGEQTTNAQVFDKYLPILQKELYDENIWLDSLQQADKLSATEYQYYKQRNNYYTTTYQTNKTTQEELRDILISYNDSIYKNDLNGYYRAYHLNIGIQYLKSIQASSNNMSLPSVYDNIEKSTEITGELSVDLRLVVLRNILETSPYEIRSEYFDRFKTTIADTVLIGQVAKQYETILNPEITKSEQLLLLDTKGNKTTLAEVLKQCEGKNIYVDFWASWCAPCMHEMPAASALRDKYIDKPVAFVYLALNDREEAWKNAIQKAGIENQKHTYLILNSKDAPFISTYNINSIPRYMIFDTKGQLLNEEAPRPGDPLLKLIY